MADKIISLPMEDRTARARALDALNEAAILTDQIHAIADLVENADNEALDPNTIESAMVVIRGLAHEARDLISQGEKAANA
jgi:hypothetical protein